MHEVSLVELKQSADVTQLDTNIASRRMTFFNFTDDMSWKKYIDSDYSRYSYVFFNSTMGRLIESGVARHSTFLGPVSDRDATGDPTGCAVVVSSVDNLG